MPCWHPISARFLRLSAVRVALPACQESPWLCSLALSILIPLCFHIEVVYPGDPAYTLSPGWNLPWSIPGSLLRFQIPIHTPLNASWFLPFHLLVICAAFVSMASWLVPWGWGPVLSFCFLPLLCTEPWSCVCLVNACWMKNQILKLDEGPCYLQIITKGKGRPSCYWKALQYSQKHAIIVYRSEVTHSCM